MRHALWIAAISLAISACEGREPVHHPPIGGFAALEARYGVSFVSKVDEHFMPESWRKPPIQGSVRRIEPAELQRFSKALATALSKYPAAVIRDNLRRICLARSMEFYGQPYGGTVDNDSVYLCSDGEDQGYDDAYLESAFHHELSSLLMRRHGFPEERWRACNPDGFRYASKENGGVRAIAEGRASREGSRDFYEQGLLSEYSRAELEEDVNMFYEQLMMDPGKLDRLASSYERIRRKLAICRQFYASIGIRMETRAK